MAVNLPANEQEQILQTIEMFEVIVQANPDDYQSLDLLREAYARLGRMGDARRVCLQKAEACLRLGQLQAAGEAIALVQSDDPHNEEAAYLASLLAEKGYTPEQPKADLSEQPLQQDNPIAFDFSSFANEDTSLTELKTRDPGSMPIDFGQIELPQTDGNEHLVEFLEENDLVPKDRIAAALETVRLENAEFSPERVATPLLLEIFKHGSQDEEDAILLKILNHTKLGFAPLNCYDVDRQIVKLLPMQFTLGRLIVPFDLISRTLLIALANPFDAEGREACLSLLDYNIQWYFARPSEIVKVLRNAYRLESRPAKPS